MHMLKAIARFQFAHFNQNVHNPYYPTTYSSSAIIDHPIIPELEGFIARVHAAVVDVFQHVPLKQFVSSEDFTSWILAVRRRIEINNPDTGYRYAM